MTASPFTTFVFTLSAALLFYAIGSVAEAQQKRIDQLDQEIRPHAARSISP